MLKSAMMLTVLMMVLMAAAACDTPASGESGEQTQTALLAPQHQPQTFPPVYVPEPFVGSFLFVFDRSADSGIVDAGATQTRLERSITHSRGVLATFTFNATHQFYFDVMSYGGAPTTKRLFGTLVPATTQNLAIADAHLGQLQPGGASPQYTALRNACLGTRDFLSTLYFYSASLPGVDANAPGGVATPANIFAAVPSWFSHFQDASTHCIRVGDVAHPHESYMQQLAALMGGSYFEI